MNDIASLAFAIDSSDARSARADLQALRETSSGASEQALRLTRAFAEGRDPIAAYRAELALIDAQMRQAGQGIDGLIDRLGRLTVTLSALGGPTRELRETIGQIDAAAAAFNATGQGMEAFVRSSRQIGLSSNEMTSGLQRIQMALQGVTEEGRRAREVLLNYGVSLDGRGSNDAAAVLREFTERLRQFRQDPGQGSDIRAVLGQTSIATIAALRDPDYRTISQREREVRQDAEAERISTLRRSISMRDRAGERSAAEMADLENEFGRSFDFGFLQAPAARRRTLEERRASGVETNSRRERNSIFGRITRGFEWLGSDEFALQGMEIDGRLREEENEAEDWFGVAQARARASQRRRQRFFGAYTPSSPVGALETNPRTAGVLAANERAEADAALSAATRAQRERFIQASQEFGVDIAGMAEMRPDQIRARLLPEQQAALDGSERAFYGAGNMDRFRQIAAASRADRLGREGVDVATAGRYGIGMTGGAASYEEQAERSRRAAHAIVQAETGITDEYSRGVRSRMEVAEIEREIEERREAATIRNNRRAADLREQSRIIARELDVDGGGSIGAEGALRVRAAERAAQAGAGSVESILGGNFDEVSAGVSRQTLTARRANESRAYRVGRMRAGDSAYDIAGDEQIDQQMRPLREAHEAISRALGEQSEQAQATRRTMEEQERTLRAQLQVTRELATAEGERNHQANMLVARAGGTGNRVLDRQQQFDASLEAMRMTWTGSPEDLERRIQERRAEFERETNSISRAPRVSAEQGREQTQARIQATGGGITLSEADLDRMARTLVSEAGRGFANQQAVGNVIMNRARQSGRSVSDVVMAPNQFEVWSDGSARRVDPNSPQYRQAREIARRNSDERIAGR